MGRIIRVLSLFSGIGAFEKALDRLGVEYDLVNYCEIDRYASKAYSLIHGVPENLNLGDITKVDADSLPKDIDLITYGFPCQDISSAGLKRGFEYEGETTRSGLFFDALRIIEAVKPRYAIAENVKNLTSKKFKTQFQTVLSSLENVGYNNYWKVLNAKDYGIPQNRERVFVVSIRKDIDKEGFAFPQSVPLRLKLKNMLEEKVDEKYYLTDIQIKRIHIRDTDSTSLMYGKSMIGFEGNAREYKEPKLVNQSKLNKINMLGMLDIKGNEQVRRVYGIDGIAPTLNTMQGGNRQLKICEQSALDEQNGYLRKDGCVGMPTTDGSSPKHNDCVLQMDFRIRKLTPKECFRLMGFDDRDVDILLENGISNTQLYKMAGNSIVVDVLEALFRSLFGLEGKREQPLLEGWG